jgi:glycosyltransferase involved in cell wall biosynthesis
MKRVLFLAYEYPPVGGVGVVRTTQFAKYLPRFGWQPTVLTVLNPDAFYTTSGQDPFPAGVRVYASFNPLNNLSVIEGGLRRLGLERKAFVPDVYGGWAASAVRDGCRLVRRERFDAVYATCPPYSAAVAGARIARATRVPFVVDLRDAWTLSPYRPTYLLPWQQAKEEQLEEEVFCTASRVVAATDAIRQGYERKYPDLLWGRTSTVMNGFDPDYIPETAEPFPRFTIAYTGFFYGAQNPEPFLRALALVLRDGRVPEDGIRFVWAGRNAPFVRQLVRDLGLEPVVEYRGLLPKPDADALLARAHLLFFLLGETAAVSQTRVLTSKLFPYLASGRRILGILPEGDAAEMIREYSESPYVVAPGDVEGCTDAIADAYERWRSGEPSGLSERTARFRKEYSVEARAQELASVFDRVAAAA